jgi:hypothetical protein
MSILILLLIGALALPFLWKLAYTFRCQLIKPQSKPHRTVKPTGSKPKPILRLKENPANALIDFMFKPKSEGKPHKPNIRTRR